MKLNFEKNHCEYITALKKLWCNVFTEKKEAVDLFFERCADFTSFYTASYEGRPVSMLFLVSAELNGKKSHYLCSAATAYEYRGNGIMGKLIEYALEDAKKNNEDYSLLFPANESLYGFYSRFGYKPLCNAGKAVFSREQLEQIAYKTQDRLLCDSIYEVERLQRVTFKNNFLLQNNKFVSFASDYYAVYGCKTLKSDNCFALVDDKSGTADVFYSLYADFPVFAELLLKKTNAERFVFTGKSDKDIFNNSQIENYGMIKSLDNTAEIPENIYIGITLN